MSVVAIIPILMVMLVYPCIAAEQKAPEEERSFKKEAYLKSARERKVLRIGLVDCIAYALKRNSDIKIKRVEPKLAADEVRIARSDFEPKLDAEYNLHDTTQKSTNRFYINDSKVRDITLNGGVSGKLVTGTEYRLDFLNERYRSNADISSINPYYLTEPVVTITQPLFRDFGILVNRADIIIAQNNKLKSDQDFKNTVMDIISQTKTAYYNYVFGLESYGIAELYLQRTRDLLDINRARYAKGLVSSVDLLESEAAVADREKYLLAAEYILKTSEDKLKFVTNLIDDPEIWNTMIELIDRPEFTVEKVDLVKCIEDAFQYRPDYQSKKIDLRNRDIRITVAKNALLPTVDVIGSFGLNGIAENYGGALNRIDRNFIDWSIGGKVEIPWGMGDRARYDQKKLEKARAILELERLEQNIILVVRDKAREVDIQYRQERAAKISKEKETENYAAQKERLAAGQVSTHDMLDYQDKLSSAELDHTKAVIDYSTALINLDKEVGLTLVKNNIKLED